MFETKYKDDILGINSTFDRVIVTGSITPISYEKGLSQFLYINRILLKEFQSYASELARVLKEYAKGLSDIANVPYIYLNNSKTRKEQVVKKIIKERGSHPGLVAILSGLEVCKSFDIHKNKKTHKLELVSRLRKCLHIYYYFIDEQLGLCYFRLQTFFPFRIQIYFNGRELLANKLDQAGIIYQKDDNCFTWLSDFDKAQELADDLKSTHLHTLFDKWAEEYVPILPALRKKWYLSYHWSIRQIEYARDIIFHSQDRLDEIYRQLLQYLTLSTMPEDIMSFLGKKLSGSQGGKIETSTKKTYLGYRVKHKNRAIIIKIYNKAGNVLRIEVTINDLSQFKVYRDVNKKDGQIVKELATLKKSIHSLGHVVHIGKAAIDRYMDFLSKMEDNSKGVKELRGITERKTENNKNYKAFNPLSTEDSTIFQTLLKGSFITNGFSNKDIRLVLSERLENLNWNTAKVSRLIKRLRIFGLVKKLHNSYRYFLTSNGKLLLAIAVKLKNLVVTPMINKSLAMA